MIRHIRVHGTNHADVINVRGDVREEVADFDAALAVRLELEGRLKGRARLALGLEIVHRQRLAVELGEHGLGIKGVHVRRPAVGEDVDDAFGLGGKLRGTRGERGVVADLIGEQTRAEQLRQAQHPKAHAAAAEKIPPREEAVLQT